MPNRYRAYQQERVAIARQFGHESIVECAASLYPEKSMAQIGELFDVTSNCVRQWLHRAEADVQRQGGANNCKFTDLEVRMIRYSHATGCSVAELEKRFNASETTIRNIIKRRVYKWV